MALTPVVLLLLAGSLAQGAVIGYTALAGFPNNEIATWSNLTNSSGSFNNPVQDMTPDQLAMPSGIAYSNTPSNKVTFSFSSGNSGCLHIATNSGECAWAINVVFGSGNFLPGTANVQHVADTMTLTFLNPVSSFGAYIQDKAFNSPLYCLHRIQWWRLHADQFER